MSNVLNSDVNIVNIALIGFCLLVVTKLAHWPILSVRWQNMRYQNAGKAQTNDNCVENYWPAGDPHKRKGSEIQDTKTFNVPCNIVSLLVDVSRLSPCTINQLDLQQKCFS